MNVYEARWNNALRIAQRINKYIDEGFIVFDEENQEIPYMTIVPERQVKVVRGHTEWNVFERDVDWDHGMHTPVKEFNRTFEHWTIAKKVDIKNVFLKDVK